MDDQQRDTDSSSSQQHVIVLSGNSDGAVLHAVYTAAARLLGAGGSVSIWDPKSTQLCTARWSRAPTRHGSAASPYRRGDDVAQHDLFLIVKYVPQVRMDMHHATCDREHGQWHGRHRPPATDIYSLGARTSHAWP